MRPPSSPAAVLWLAAMLLPAVALAGRIVFPDENYLPLAAENVTSPRRAVQASSAGKQQHRAETPSPCVWAILSCCEPGRPKVRPRCFQLLGCGRGGDFWDVSPCSEHLVQAAVSAASRFYRNGTSHESAGT